MPTCNGFVIKDSPRSYSRMARLFLTILLSPLQPPREEIHQAFICKLNTWLLDKPPLYVTLTNFITWMFRNTTKSFRFYVTLHSTLFNQSKCYSAKYYIQNIVHWYKVSSLAEQHHLNCIFSLSNIHRCNTFFYRYLNTFQ